MSKGSAALGDELDRILRQLQMDAVEQHVEDSFTTDRTQRVKAKAQILSAIKEHCKAEAQEGVLQFAALTSPEQQAVVDKIWEKRQEQRKIVE